MCWKLTSRSDINWDDYKIIQISTILVSSVETTTKVDIADCQFIVLIYINNTNFSQERKDSLSSKLIWLSRAYLLGKIVSQINSQPTMFERGNFQI